MAFTTATVDIAIYIKQRGGTMEHKCGRGKMLI